MKSRDYAAEKEHAKYQELRRKLKGDKVDPRVFREVAEDTFKKPYSSIDWHGIQSEEQKKTARERPGSRGGRIEYGERRE